MVQVFLISEGHDANLADVTRLTKAGFDVHLLDASWASYRRICDTPPDVVIVDGHEGYETIMELVDSIAGPRVACSVPVIVVRTPMPKLQEVQKRAPHLRSVHPGTVTPHGLEALVKDTIAEHEAF